MVKFLAASVALLLPLAACGGSDDTSSGDTSSEGVGDPASTTQSAATDGEPASDGAGGASTQTTEGGATTSPPPDAGDTGGDTEGSGPSTATATLGGETYNFSTEGAMVAQCKTDLFGIYSVQLPRIDGDGSISIVALREGTDPSVIDEVNSVQVAIDDEDWVADEASDIFEMSDALQPGMSQVDSVEFDGRTVRGSATFFRQNSAFSGELETVTGTFEATCGEERVS